MPELCKGGDHVRGWRSVYLFVFGPPFDNKRQQEQKQPQVLRKRNQLSSSLRVYTNDDEFREHLSSLLQVMVCSVKGKKEEPGQGTLRYTCAMKV